MTSRSARAVMWIVLGFPSGAIAAQDATLRAELSADSVEMAQVFDLVVHVEVPPGSAVYFPDTVTSTPDVESFEPVAWRAERAGSGATLTLRYPIIPFASGAVRVPGVDVVVAPSAAAEGEEAESIPGDSRVGRWADAPRGSSAVRRGRSEELVVRVAPVQTDEELAEGAMPMPPDDVVGFGWSWPHVMLIGLFSSALAAAGTTTTKDWIGRRRRAAPLPTAALGPDEARRAALAEIDRLLAGAPYPEDRERSVYVASSDVMRRYVERLDAAWGPALTSTELMRRFGAIDATIAPLARELADAERVKFGRLRTGSDGIQSHLGALRAWLAARREEAGS